MTLMNCIERVPGKLAEISERKFDCRFISGDAEKKQSACEPADADEWKASNGEIVIVASGSSYNAAFTAKMFLENTCGFRVTLMYPNIFVNYTPDIRKEAMHLFISQGGQTRLVYEGLLAAKKAGCVTYAMTAKKDCVIAEAADYFVDMGCGEEEYLYRTIGFSATAASVMMLGAHIALKQGRIGEEELAEIKEDLRRAAGNLEKIKQDTLGWYEANRFSLLRRNTMLVSATGDLWPVAQESDIKAMEMVPMMTKSYELEEFIHGPQNAFHDGMLFILYSKEGEDEEKVQKIAAFLKKEIGFRAVIGKTADKEDKRDMALSAESRYFAPLEYITFMQVTAFKMAEARGRDLSRGVNSVIGQYIQKTVEGKNR